MTAIAGWDVGGANVKVTWLPRAAESPALARTASLPFEIWRAREQLPDVARAALAEVSRTLPGAMALTMTAELSDAFATKREGVLFVLEAMHTAFPECPIYALSLDGAFVPLVDAMQYPLDFAAANWLATALWLAGHCPDALLVDVGSTTTDIIPIHGGRVVASGRTDMGRLQTGELVYTGMLRTHLAAIIQSVPVGGVFCPVSSEYFTISGDVHLILGTLSPGDYACGTPDGRPATPEAARGRLARLVCADTDQLSAAQIDEMARYIYEAQIAQITRGLAQVLARTGARRDLPIIAAGLGASLAREAAQRLGMQVLDLAEDFGRDVSLVAPSWAAAHLLAAHLDGPAGREFEHDLRSTKQDGHDIRD